jgi:hypothetical protein
VETTPPQQTVNLDLGQIVQDLDFGYRKGTVRDADRIPTVWPIFVEPNPFNPETTISFSVPGRSFVTMRIYDVAGRLVRTLANEEFPAGDHKRDWDGRNDVGQSVASGVYFLRLVANNSSQTKKLMLIK